MLYTEILFHVYKITPTTKGILFARHIMKSFMFLAIATYYCIHGLFDSDLNLVVW